MGFRFEDMLNGRLAVIEVTRINGEPLILHKRYPHDPTRTVSDNEDYQCQSVTALRQPTHDGAQTIVHVVRRSLRNGLASDLSGRCKESLKDIFKSFRDAGFETMPPVTPQSPGSMAMELGRNLGHNAAKLGRKLRKQVLG